MADRYWVGGTASWDGTAGTKWAATSGGPGGESVPTTADDVFFDATSSGTCTIAAGNTGAKSITCTGFTGTLTGSTNITVAGNITLVAGMTYTYSATVTVTGTSTITSAGKTFSNLTVDGVGITVTLGDQLNTGVSRGVTVTRGTFDTAGYNLTCDQFNSNNSNTRTINLNNSTVTIAWRIQLQTSTGLTFNAGTSQINMTRQTGADIATGGQTFYNVTFTAVTLYLINISGVNTFNNLTVEPLASNGVKFFTFSDNQTINGTLTYASGSPFSRVFLYSNAIGTTRTLTVNAISVNDADFRDITIAGSAAGSSPTRAGDGGGNSGLTFPAAKTVYRVGTNTTWFGSSSWALTSGAAGSNDNFPLAQDTAVINEDTTLTGTLSIAECLISTVDFSARTTGITFNFGSQAGFYGSFTLGSGVTITGTSTQAFNGRGTMVFTSAGKTITFLFLVDTPGGTFELGDAFSSSNSVTLTRGTFDAKTYTFTATSFASSNSNTRTLKMGTGAWTLSGTGTVWDLGTVTNLTFDAGTANITLSNTSSTARTFAGGGLAYNDLTIGGASGTSTLTISGSNTFKTLASTKTVAHTISFTGGTTQRLTTGFTVSGTTGNVVTIGSTNTTAVTLIKPTAWYVGANSTDGGNNTGLSFISGGGIDYLSISRINGRATYAGDNNLLFGSNF